MPLRFVVPVCLLLCNTIVATAQAQVGQTEPQTQSEATAQTAGKPNILVIYGDDIGITNISAYSDGLMGYETPNIDRIGKEGLRFLQYYGEQSCTAGRSAFLTGQHSHSHRTKQGRLPRCANGHEPARSLHRRDHEEPWICHWTVRQEPCRRPQRVAADRQWLRRVLRQSLSLQRRGRAGAARLSQGSGIPQEVRASWRASNAGRPTPTIRPSTRASARSASRKSRIPARSPRSAWRRSTMKPRRPRSIS